MNFIDFLTEACLYARLLDLSNGCTVDDVLRSLGDGYLDDVDKKKRFVRRDYGLLEFTFLREYDYTCRWISIDVHRLAEERPGTVPQAIERRYGRFPKRIPFQLVSHPLVQTRGIPLTADESDAGYSRYVLSESGAEIFVVRDADGNGPRSGDIWSIVINSTSDGGPRPVETDPARSRLAPE